jgi:hypothetical protein
VNIDSHVSATFMESVHGGNETSPPISVAVEETRDGKTRRLMAERCPRKTQREGLLLPLYTGYDPEAVDVRLQQMGLKEEKP